VHKKVSEPLLSLAEPWPAPALLPVCSSVTRDSRHQGNGTGLTPAPPALSRTRCSRWARRPGAAAARLWWMHVAPGLAHKLRSPSPATSGCFRC